MEMIHTCYRVTDRDDATLQRLAGQGIEPERRPYQVREAAPDSASCAIRMVSFEG
jgi:hypothetical protein